MNTLQMLISYFLRILPGIGLIILVFILIKPNVYFRTVIYIFTFILMRDAMTPLGLWTLGKENEIVWLRMSSDSVFLIIFATCHIFLAITVTGIGLPILIFTLWEGIIAGLVGSRYGVIPATITHGGAIFILSAGLI